MIYDDGSYILYDDKEYNPWCDGIIERPNGGLICLLPNNKEGYLYDLLWVLAGII